MEKLLLLVVTMAATISYLSAGKLLVLSAAYTFESPSYSVVHLESDFEIRLYKEISWMSALVHGTSFLNSTRDGFHRLYQYLHGANLNSTHFSMTKPVLTSISPSHHGSSSSSYTVRYYLPSEYKYKSPPQPSAELNLQLDKWKSQCIAVRMFPGYANDDNVEKEKDALVSSLTKRLPALMQAVENNLYYNYSIAQYNASKHRTGRINEVWMDVSGFTAEGCPV
ncbi:Heme-binding 2 [Gossypium arboreum]|uniref:Uncharacterized protein n=2 Tax=Gossypium arboreum TaxID=29729 RepID=A0ABR0QI86_GOSAR|nr:uncharacterized protein LOC108475828 isoform X1 [Gossypium arboreum]KAK5838746.1 hypothetical protein PVK06_007483 [Gossypium arboreum]KHG12458.1 Heme-binding 2 [Gossypium arboreum]